MRSVVWGLVLVMALGACAAERRGNGAPPVAAASPACLKACARDDSVCADATSARRDTSPLFGTTAGCERQLRACQRRCAPE